MKTNKVTSFTKVLAAVLFIALPFFGFYLGMQYQNTVTPSEDQTSVNIVKPKNNTVVVDKVPVATQTADMRDWKIYQDTKLGIYINYPQEWKIKETSYNGLNETKLLGSQGEIVIIKGNSNLLGYGCTPKQYKKIQIQGRLLNSCHFENSNGSETWAILKKQIDNNMSFTIQAVANIPAIVNKNMILKILSTFRFE